ncbi:RNA pyrophosphohydrolase [uncultured Roseobacter sp.]|uniref:RNA pyrophosphohydrolase n=1 Tax=uncultured Roseobacter sp. TaxID=114847 RepID=UPI00262DABE1|nr:RNA pyrophosphohydrolase [uncultured Roseobacter sp.]
MSPEEIEKLPYRPCVGVMLMNAGGEVFVGQRIDSKVAAWQMPQGGIDAGEEAQTAALRELTEETGVTADKVTVVAESPRWLPYELPHDLVPKLWKGRFRGQQQKWFLMRFHGSDSDIRIEQEHQEFAEWRWLPVNDLVDNIVPFKRDVYAAVLKDFRGYF